MPSQRVSPMSSATSDAPQLMASRGLAQIMGIHPMIAFLAIVVDLMLFTGEVGSLGLLWPVSVAVGAALGYITYRAQMRFYADDHDAALVKGLALGLITMIPTPLPAVVYVPSGLIGFIHSRLKK